MAKIDSSYREELDAEYKRAISAVCRSMGVAGGPPEIEIGVRVAVNAIADRKDK